MNRFTLLILSVGCLIVASPIEAQKPALAVICEHAAQAAESCNLRDAAVTDSSSILEAVKGFFGNFLDCDGKKDLVRQCKHVGSAMQGNCDGDQEPIPTLDGLCSLIEMGIHLKQCDAAASTRNVANDRDLDEVGGALMSLLQVVTCDQLTSFQGECRRGYAALESCAAQKI